MPNDDVFNVVAIGTWLYDGTVPRRIELLSKPATMASSRWIEDRQSGEFMIDETAPVPQTQDGLLYQVGATGGGEFFSVAEAIAWADKQPWGPVEWVFLQARA